MEFRNILYDSCFVFFKLNFFPECLFQIILTMSSFKFDFFPVAFDFFFQLQLLISITNTFFLFVCFWFYLLNNIEFYLRTHILFCRPSTNFILMYLLR